MGISIKSKKKKSRRIPRKNIPVIPEYDETPLPSTESDKKNFKRFQERNFKKMSPESKKELDMLLKQLDESLSRYEGDKAAKKMATDEFRQSMKKPGAVDKYAGQAWEKDRPKRVREEERKHMDALQEQLESEYKGMQRESKRVTGKSLNPIAGPTVRSIMGKKYRQKMAKGGYIKKYARGSGGRKAR